MAFDDNKRQIDVQTVSIPQFDSQNFNVNLKNGLKINFDVNNQQTNQQDAQRLIELD